MIRTAEPITSSVIPSATPPTPGIAETALRKADIFSRSTTGTITACTMLRPVIIPIMTLSAVIMAFLIKSKSSVSLSSAQIPFKRARIT